MERKCIADLPTEILGLILSNQGKSDLFASRLVCRTWNEECKNVIKTRFTEFTQTVTEANIKNYLDFVSDPECFPREAGLPLHLNIKFHPVNRPNDLQLENLNEIILNNLKWDLDYLYFICGEGCVTKLTLKTTGVNITTKVIFEKLWLIDILIKVSAGLEVLDLSGCGLAVGDIRLPTLKTKLEVLRFPKLKTLICYKYDGMECRRMRITLRTTCLVQFIIRRSQNLEHLEQVDILSMIKLPINYDRLKTLLIEGDLTTLSTALEKFRESKFPALETLNIKLYYTYDKYDMYNWITTNILEFCSATLKSLTIKVYVVYHSINAKIPRAILMTFPRLPKLRHLRLDMNARKDELIFLEPVAINFSSDTFPSLKSIELPLGYIFSDKLSIPADTEFIPIKFPKVNELTVRLNNCRDPGALKHLQKIFPNISTLSIVNERIKAHKQCVKHLIQHVIQSPLSKNIQQFDMIGFEEDFLGQVLGQLQENMMEVQGRTDKAFILSNVRKVRLGLSAETHFSCRSDDPFSRSFLPLPNLTAIAKYFPAIQIIEISRILFRGMCELEWRFLIEILESKFPYLGVHVMKE